MSSKILILSVLCLVIIAKVQAQTLSTIKFGRTMSRVGTLADYSAVVNRGYQVYNDGSDAELTSKNLSIGSL